MSGKNYDELKRLAEAAERAHEAHLRSDSDEAYGAWVALDDLFNEKADAAAVLSLIAEVERLTAENEKFDEGLRALACRLSAGGYNAETLTADQIIERVTWVVNTQALTDGKMIDDLRAAHQLELESHRKTFSQLEQAKRLMVVMRSSLSCESVPHTEFEQHWDDAPCPVLARIDAFLEVAR